MDSAQSAETVHRATKALEVWWDLEAYSSYGLDHPLPYEAIVRVVLAALENDGTSEIPDGD